MTNNRQKGKRIERWWATELREFWPNIRRNAGTQAQSGGRDLEETPGWSWEIKGGLMYKSKMIRDVIDQAKMEAGGKDLTAIGMKPDREDPYVIIPLNDFREVLRRLASANLL